MADHEAYVRGQVKEAQLRDRIRLLQECRRKGMLKLKEVDRYEIEKRREESAKAASKRRDSVSYSLFDSGRVSTSQDRVNRARNRQKSAAGAGLALIDLTTGGKSETNPAEGAAAATTAIDPFLAKIKASPQVEELSTKEIELCHTLKLLPEQYLPMKKRIVTDSVRLGYVKKNGSRHLIKMRKFNRTAFKLLHLWMIYDGAEQYDTRHTITV